MKAGTRSTKVAFALSAVLCAFALSGAGIARAQIFSNPLAPKATPAPRPIPVLQAPVPGFEFPQHETLTYAVDWRVFQGGIAVFHLDQPTPGNLNISATADTTGAVNMLFPVIDRFQSSMDTKAGCSGGLHKQTQEGRRKIASDLLFDHDHGKQTLNERNLVKGTATHKEANVPACVTDLLSAIFYTQSQTLTQGQTVSFPLADSMRTVTVGMKVESREEIKTPAGTFQAVKVQATAEEGVVKNRGQIWIWYSDDPRHLPVQMQVKLFQWGITLTFHLQSVEMK